NSILYLDCKNLEYENIKSNKKFDYSIVMVYSGIERVLYETSYNKRVEECKNAGEKMFEFSKKKFSKEIFLRDIPKEIYIKYKDRLPENLRKRCQHFYDEMERVEKGIELWKKGDIEEFGKLIKASGESSIKNYECGAEELIKIFENLNSIEGVYGARFSGAGFRGWCFGFIKNDKKIKMNAKEILKNEYLKIYPQYASNFKVIFVDKKKELKFNLST
ncbi:MAG: GHMP kinase, partial [Candidatus Omnitrophica bacterium]|nr:GHMP kinase [Candidatus Omnitrophota bacterium]